MSNNITAAPGVSTKAGTYIGNGADNLGVAHGLGSIPKLVQITEPTGSRTAFLFVVNGIVFLLNLVNGTNVVNVGYAAITLPTKTNFYVGEAGSYTISMNGAGQNYYWTAWA